jgi:hypothetical protein
MTLRAYHRIPGWGNLPLRCQAPVDYLRGTEVVCGCFAVGGQGVQERAQQRQKVPALHWQSQALCRSGPIEGH